MPILTYDQRAIGVVHVGLKQPTPVNPHGYYTEADEDFLDSLQTEMVAFYERQHLRATVQHAIQDLHDALGLATYNVLYGLGRVQEELRQEDYVLVASRLRELESQTQSVVRNIRGVMLGLHSHALDELGLADALQQYLQRSVQRPALAVQFTTTGEEGHLSASLIWQLYRIAQEALTNVVKHAHATGVACQVQFEPTRITLGIRDNGQGYDPASLQPTAHYGLQTMQERARALGGACEMHTAPGAGTTVTVRVPRLGEQYGTTTL
jgi:signal transduction histidine kinase